MRRKCYVGALVALLCLVGCGAGLTARQASIVTLNTVASAANAATPKVLEAMCVSELTAVHHTGRMEAGRCIRTDAPREATESERAELARVRATWGEVRPAYEAFAAAHDATRAALEVVDQRGDPSYVLSALGTLAQAYEALRRVAEPHGVRLPSLLGGS